MQQVPDNGPAERRTELHVVGRSLAARIRLGPGNVMFVSVPEPAFTA
jgi:hypothetical protein